MHSTKLMTADTADGPNGVRRHKWKVGHPLSWQFELAIGRSPIGDAAGVSPGIGINYTAAI